MTKFTEISNSKIIGIFFLFFTIISCSESPSPSPGTSNLKQDISFANKLLGLASAGNNNYCGSMQTAAANLIIVGNEPPEDYQKYHFGVYGTIYNNTTDRIATPVGLMICSGISILPDSTANYSKRSFNFEFFPTYGATTTWSMQGNTSANIPAFSSSMYVPQLLYVHITSTNVQKNSGVQLTWNADPNNTLGVVIWLDEFLHEFQDSTKMHFVIVPDNGSYIIPASAFNNYSIGSSAGLSVMRGNYQSVADSAGRYYDIIARTASDMILDIIQ